MKKLILAALAALPLIAASARADGCGPFCGCWFPTRIEAGGNLYLHLKGPNECPAQLGPWYLYWPMEAHFQTPANMAYPYWPAPMTLPVPVRAASGAPGPGNFQPASYMASPYGSPAPGYWAR